MEKVKREIKDMSHIGLRPNNPKDFVDYSFSYYMPETSNRIEAAAEKFLTEIGRILEDDRAEADKIEPHTTSARGSICGSGISNKTNNWISINLPENCPNACISFKRDIAEMQIKDFGAKPLYGFDSKKEDWLPVEIFITYGGSLAPDQRRQET